jgi:hypothetical protein
MKNLLLAAAALSTCLATHAQSPAQSTPDPAEDRYGFHAQTTYIWQTKPAFAAAYSGPNSLQPQHERSYSFTATADLGLRLWQGAQLHFNPEAAQGLPLSRLQGAGGLSNGELARTSGPNLTLYKARLFVQQRWSAGGESETLEADFNELGGAVAARRWTLTAGTFSLLDYFDNNPYAKDPREQFMNWSFLTHGAWDYAADGRGYSNGALLEYRTPQWALRGARMMQPRQSNGLDLDPRLGLHYGDQLELESDLPLTLPAGPVRARLLVFRNRINAGSFADALALGGVPSVSLVRRDQVKTGWGLTLEAPTGTDAGVFLRASRNNGQLETYAFTEIDQQLSIGGQFSGAAWQRSQDKWGVALALNALSPTHRDYLAAGGLGFFLGDGALNYGRERIFETYYRYALPELSTRVGKLQSAASIGFQQIANPGYNRDRGPVRVISLRWHSEF